MKSAVALAITLSFLPAPAMAQRPTQCDGAIVQAEQILARDGRDLTIVDTNTSDGFEYGYEDYPMNRPYILAVVIAGRHVDDVMNSPVLLATATRAIVRGCYTVGLVQYWADQTDWSTSFGLVGDVVRKFECIEPDVTPRWGQIGCI